MGEIAKAEGTYREMGRWVGSQRAYMGRWEMGVITEAEGIHREMGDGWDWGA